MPLCEVSTLHVDTHPINIFSGNSINLLGLALYWRFRFTQLTQLAWLFANDFLFSSVQFMYSFGDTKFILQRECLHLWQAGCSLTGSLHTSLTVSIEMVVLHWEPFSLEHCWKSPVPWLVQYHPTLVQCHSYSTCGVVRTSGISQTRLHSASRTIAAARPSYRVLGTSSNILVPK